MAESIPFFLLGATGRVGRMVVRSLRTSSGPFSEIPVQTRRKEIPNSSRHVYWEVLGDSKELGDWIELYGIPRAMVVLSGVTPDTGARMDDNIDIALSSLEAARRYGIGRVLFSSSSAVYGAGKGHPISEDDDCNPISEYGHSKLKMEQRILGDKSGVLQTEVCFLRIGNVVGADALLLNADKGKTVSIDRFADGKGPLRSYISPGDLAQTIVGLATFNGLLPSVINVAATEPVRMDALASAANLAWLFKQAPTTALQTVTLDCKRLLRLLPFLKLATNPYEMIKDWERNKCDDLEKTYF